VSSPIIFTTQSSHGIDNPIPRPGPAEDLNCDLSKPYASGDTCFPTDSTAVKSWSLSEIFGRPIRGICPLAEVTRDGPGSLCINIPNEREVSASGVAIEHRDPSGLSRCYTLSMSDFDIGLSSSSSDAYSPLDPPLLHAERSITGHGQERGGIRTILRNPSKTHSLDFVYFETLPWIMRPFVHTLQAKLSESSGSNSSENLIQETFYRPAVDRHRGTQLELLMSIPPDSTITLTYDFEKAILRYTEYPPDANRGFNVAPAVIRILPNGRGSDSEDSSVYLRTTSLLLPLPTPDFSMPYNVIILTSTVMALAFGSIFNLLVRRFVGADEVEGFDLRSVKGRIQGKLIGLRDKLAGKVKKVE
jgi:phosphatidylinositol glycan class T